MDTNLSQVAKDLVANGRGIFAADAGPKTLAKRAAEINLSLETVDQRLKYRTMTISTPGLSQYIGGVILHEEAMSLVSVLNQQGIKAGLKVDQGTVEMTSGSIEKITEGLEKLDQKLADASQAGAKFSKWRAVIIISSATPSSANVEANCETLARYAKLSQKAGLVPIIEPEVLMEGTHPLERCADVTRLVGKKMFASLLKHEIDLTGMLYKPNMVLAGKDCPSQPTVTEIAQKTVEVMQEIVPPKVPGIVFLSGGQEAGSATQRLNEIAKLGGGSPWRWSFSFERGLEGPAMQTWQGQEANIVAAQKMLLHRAKCNSLASLGKYTAEVEHEI
ncbi:MAG: class I fructose-bisphosphate aldolase [bacterium]|nr:class I fructose-bisphosphate aldolase [bacterium]